MQPPSTLPDDTTPAAALVAGSDAERVWQRLSLAERASVVRSLQRLDGAGRLVARDGAAGAVEMPFSGAPPTHAFADVLEALRHA